MKRVNFTYRKKKQLLIVLLVLLVFLSYKRIIKNSFRQIVNYNSKTSDNFEEEDINTAIHSLKQKIKKLDDVLGEEDFDQNFIQQDILEFLSVKANNNKIDIVKVDAPHFFYENDYLMVSNTFTIKGNYNALAKTVKEIESEFKKSKLNSVSYYKKKNYSRKKEELYVRLFFQNFKKN